MALLQCDRILETNLNIELETSLPLEIPLFYPSMVARAHTGSRSLAFRKVFPFGMIRQNQVEWDSSHRLIVPNPESYRRSSNPETFSYLRFYSIDRLLLVVSHGPARCVALNFTPMTAYHMKEVPLEFFIFDYSRKLIIVSL